MKDQRTHLENKRPRLDVSSHVKVDAKRLARELRGRETPGEKILWDALRDRKLEGRKFRRQQPIGPFVVDFYCAEERLVVEVDGSVHDDEAQMRADVDRQRVIESVEYTFVRLSDALVRTDLTKSLEQIKAAFKRK